MVAHLEMIVPVAVEQLRVPHDLRRLVTRSKNVCSEIPDGTRQLSRRRWTLEDLNQFSWNAATLTRSPPSMYVHPWDVADEGADSVLERITSTGITTVNLATSYHSGRYLLQHNPKKKVYFAEEGV